MAMEYPPRLQVYLRTSGRGWIFSAAFGLFFLIHLSRESILLICGQFSGNRITQICHFVKDYSFPRKYVQCQVNILNIEREQRRNRID